MGRTRDNNQVSGSHPAPEKPTRPRTHDLLVIKNPEDLTPVHFKRREGPGVVYDIFGPREKDKYASGCVDLDGHRPVIFLTDRHNQMISSRKLEVRQVGNMPLPWYDTIFLI